MLRAKRNSTLQFSRVQSRSIAALFLPLAFAFCPNLRAAPDPATQEKFKLMQADVSSSTAIPQDAKARILAWIGQAASSAEMGSHIPAPEKPREISLVTPNDLFLSAAMVSFGTDINAPSPLNFFSLGIQEPSSNAVQGFDEFTGPIVAELVNDFVEPIDPSRPSRIEFHEHCRLKTLPSGALSQRRDIVFIRDASNNDSLIDFRMDARRDLYMANDENEECGALGRSTFVPTGLYQQWILYHGGRPVQAQAIAPTADSMENMLFHHDLFPGQELHLADITIVGCPQSLPVPLLPQNDPSWNPPNYTEPYDAIAGTASTLTIAKKGCALTSTAMVFNFYGSTHTPASLNTELRKNSGYCGEALHWGVAACLSGGKADLVEYVRLGTKRKGALVTPEKIKEIMDQDLRNGRPAIVKVRRSDPVKKTNDHWVVVTGPKCGDTWLINDPNPRGGTKLKDYGNNAFSLVRYRKGAETLCPIFLSACARSPIELLASDPLGNSTGFEPATGDFLVDIDNSGYFEDGLEDDITGESAPDTAKQLNILSPTPGAYKIQAIGTGFGLFHLDFLASTSRGTLIQQSFAGVAAPGQTSTFDISYDPAQSTPFHAVRAATFESTNKDVEQLRFQNQIDNDGIAKSLTQKLRNAQIKLVFSANKKTARSILNALINELEALRGKHITDTAFEILEQDVEFLLKALNEP